MKIFLLNIFFLLTINSSIAQYDVCLYFTDIFIKEINGNKLSQEYENKYLIIIGIPLLTTFTTVKNTIDNMVMDYSDVFYLIRWEEKFMDNRFSHGCMLSIANIQYVMLFYPDTHIIGISF